ncbi:transporter substrate-binding domain-containing protein [Brachyspira hyodysenteriae]|uniref:transporter substrate-binding domain-containing protein n=1 Tax=Brachyspira hyodysenteriae TaxID=159 RepID=UPI0022CD5908|nr:transporter substrate-binding domain-containing protein [Brachyspira hyodysenteriae]MCZ9850117.1 transporter substrate-binding domain-containing protein [Brachyspira hyodysenteriae]MCZ9861060.1 transporter substrate-binding domain-containing protein [Brachyspira hyodysenteriae]MCZ9892440.1 transporter substrate-binding domain-containing protein [Brachyspira hyodysenteriae]MCZ9894716.1 transporter substrate-binding domain-containing protein [Brachyspira hyodysenteriae]MCZ9917631.1 transporte
MKKIILIILMILSLLISCKKPSENTPIKNEISTNQYVNVGIYVYDYPFGYLSNGNIGGFDYDLMNEISKISGSNINFIPMRFEELMPALESKKIDAIIAGMTVTDERKQYLNFSDKYYTSSQAVLVKTDNESIQTEEDLIGKKVGVIRGTVADTMISAKEGIEIERFDTGSSIILSLKVGNVDAAIFDKATCDHFVMYDKSIKLADQIKYPEEDYAIAFRKEENIFLNEVNKALSQIMTNGLYNKLIEKHLGSN